MFRLLCHQMAYGIREGCHTRQASQCRLTQCCCIADRHSFRAGLGPREPAIPDNVPIT